MPYAQPIVRFLTQKLGRRPLGIWVAWLGLAYAAMAFSGKLTALWGAARLDSIAAEECLANWAIILAAIVALARRRLIARMFCGMAMTILFFHSLFHSDNPGMALSIAVLPCLLANRRWFDERMPTIGR